MALMKCLWSHSTNVNGKAIAVENDELRFLSRDGLTVALSVRLASVSVTQRTSEMLLLLLNDSVAGEVRVRQFSPGDCEALCNVLRVKRRRSNNDEEFKSESATTFYGPPDLRVFALVAAPVAVDVLGPFRQLRDALAHVPGDDARRRVFSRELGQGGAREFLLATPQDMAVVVEGAVPDERWFYEVICEGVPCKLFLDVEFATEANRDLDGRGVMRGLLRLLIECLRLNFSMLTLAEASYYIDTQSLYAHKFSHHVVFPRVVFANVLDMGAFMESFRSYVALRVESQPDAAACFVACDKPDRVFVCDMGVYSRNRNFRCTFCTKAGKRAPLVPVSAETSDFDRRIFLESLVCHFEGAPPSCQLRFEEAPAAVAPRACHSARSSQAGGNGVASPFPLVDGKVRELVQPGGGFVRSALYFAASHRLCYSIGGTYRFCANIGRPHKSNGIYFVVDVSTREMVQRCYDPDCRKFSSMPKLLDAHLFLLSDEQLLEAASALKVP